MADNQNNLKGLKFLVIFMGVLIIAGVITIISTIIYRLNDDTLFTSDNSDIDIVTDINLADNAEIQSIASNNETITIYYTCLLYTSPSPRDLSTSRMPSSA